MAEHAVGKNTLREEAFEAIRCLRNKRPALCLGRGRPARSPRASLYDTRRSRQVPAVAIIRDQLTNAAVRPPRRHQAMSTRISAALRRSTPSTRSPWPTNSPLAEGHRQEGTDSVTAPAKEDGGRRHRRPPLNRRWRSGRSAPRWCSCSPDGVPIAYAVWLSLQRYTRGARRHKFIWFDNYVTILSDPTGGRPFVVTWPSIVSVTIGSSSAWRWRQMHRRSSARARCARGPDPAGIVTVAASYSWYYAWTPGTGLANCCPRVRRPNSFHRWPSSSRRGLEDDAVQRCCSGGLALVPQGSAQRRAGRRCWRVDPSSR